MIFPSIFGLGAALAAMSADRSPFDIEVRPTRRRKRDVFIPNDHGPIIDSTRESKRARRRRFAREARSNG